jgi:hypothetical protein
MRLIFLVIEPLGRKCHFADSTVSGLFLVATDQLHISYQFAGSGVCQNDSNTDQVKTGSLLI